MYTQLMFLHCIYALHIIVSPLIADREVQRILLELLNQMDGFDQSVNVKVCTTFSNCLLVSVN